MTKHLIEIVSFCLQFLLPKFSVCSIYDKVNYHQTATPLLKRKFQFWVLEQFKFLLQWLDLLRSMMTEVEWRISNYVPTPEEYMENAAMTFALGPIVLPALYLVGPKIPESVVRDSEYNELFRLMSTCGRLLNDVQTYEVYATICHYSQHKKINNIHKQPFNYMIMIQYLRLFGKLLAVMASFRISPAP